MKKKLTMIVGIAVAVIAMILVILLCIPKKKVAFMPENQKSEHNEGKMLELIAILDTEEEAQEIADAYGIILLQFDYKVATFVTDKSYEEIQAIGKEKGLIELSLNIEQTVY